MPRIDLGVALASAAVPLAGSLVAQLLAARQRAFPAGHYHLNVTDAASHLRFWVGLLGGEAAKFGSANVVRFPGALLFLREQEPLGASSGSTADHLAFGVPDLDGLVRRMTDAGIELVTHRVVPGCTGDIHHSTSQDLRLAFADGPDRMRVELMEDPGLRGTVIHHVHIYTDDDAATQAWYARVIGGKPGIRGLFRKVDLPGIELSFARSAGPVAPTKGRVLDHIGFEVDGLENFCEGLRRKGVRLDRPSTSIGGTGVSEAAFTDPWGTCISLTEGLAEF